MKNSAFLRRHSTWFAVAVASAVLTLAADPAWAAGADVFAGFGDKLWAIGEATVTNVGRGAALVSAAWAILAWMGKLGHFSTAIGIFAGSVFLGNLTTVINYIFPGG